MNRPQFTTGTAEGPSASQESSALVQETPEVRGRGMEQNAPDLEKTVQVLRDAVNSYADQYDFAPVGYLTIDENGRIQKANITVARMLDRERALLIDTPLLTFVAKGSVKTFLDHLRRCRTLKAEVTSEIELRANNRITPVHLVSLPVFDATRHTTHYRTALTDLTQRRIAEQALEESEQRLRELVEWSPDAIFIENEGRFSLVNRATVELFGAADAATLLGKDVVHFVHPSSIDLIVEAMRRMKKEGRDLPFTDARMLKIDGSVIDVEIAARAFSGDRHRVAHVVVRDVTERKRADLLVHQAEERFSKAFRGSPLSTSITTLETGLILDVNDAFLRLYGFQREDVIGRTGEEAGFVRAGFLREQIAAELREHRSVRNLERTVEVRSGARMQIITSCELIEIAGEQCVLSISEDVTERRRLERDILEISDREQSRVGQDLHDGLCQNLAGIAFLGDGLAKQLAAGKISTDAAAVEMRNLAGLVKTAIDEAHSLAKGLYPVRLEQHGLTSALDEFASDITERFKIACTFQHDSDINISDAHLITHLYRIAQEAVSNAVKHSKAKQIAIELRKSQEHLTLAVRDDGVGIPSQLERPGMGLRTMQYRARMIDGALEIRNRIQSRGTAVICTIPNPQP